VLLWVALGAASGLTVLTLRSMALAFSHAFAAQPSGAVSGTARRPCARARRGYLGSQEAILLLTEIALSVGIVLTVVGLAAMAALPGYMMIGALLAQVAVLGSLVAPAVTVRIGSSNVRPAAMALAIAQLANVAFFIKAIYALM
jgi:hypothetical protein